MTFRLFTAVLAAWYFFTAVVHAGLLPAIGHALPVAPLVEAALGLVLLASLVFLAPLIAYAVALVGTLFGLAIVLPSGLGFDLGAHLVMLAGLAIGFVFIFRARTAASR